MIITDAGGVALGHYTEAAYHVECGIAWADFWIKRAADDRNALLARDVARRGLPTPP